MEVAFSALNQNQDVKEKFLSHFFSFPLSEKKITCGTLCIENTCGSQIEAFLLGQLEQVRKIVRVMDGDMKL